MKNTAVSTPSPDPSWDEPAKVGPEVISRYLAFVQIPSWRASVKHGGGERSGCLTADAARLLGLKMHRAIESMASRRGVPTSDLVAHNDDLVELSHLVGRHVARADRCSSKVHWHFQRAHLLNAAGYRCEYCLRSAASVFAEDTGNEPRRTLRFEIDHRVTRRRLADPERFDPTNLVAACRSCNTIKAEMSEERFRQELRSLALGYVRSRDLGVDKAV